ncbi:YheV family putative metal-binding protein [Aliikangiella sp. IMCC44359]|uniref:YheV family putative metal-binding protein n=1 Tax=Aliikangiella sp. IMCC44359 TaxID=3459125 RepID=UPI00403B1BD9
MKPNQRFIAGATCPNCNEIDSLVINTQDQSIECVDCQYIQTSEQRDNKEKVFKPEKSIPEKVNVSDIIRINNLKS